MQSVILNRFILLFLSPPVIQAHVLSREMGEEYVKFTINVLQPSAFCNFAATDRKAVCCPPCNTVWGAHIK